MPVRSHGTLVANNVTTVTLTTTDSTQVLPVSIGFPETVNGAPFAKPVHRVSRKVRSVEIISRDALDIFFRTDGVNPTVGGSDTEVCTAESSVVVQISPTNSAEIRLISNGNANFSVIAR
jgi:hypothetical protein